MMTINIGPIYNRIVFATNSITPKHRDIVQSVFDRIGIDTCFEQKGQGCEEFTSNETDVWIYFWDDSKMQVRGNLSLLELTALVEVMKKFAEMREDSSLSLSD
jgi:hypothetical protein